MASNALLKSVPDRGWLNGFGNMFRKETHAWWGTWRWSIQVAIWLVIVNGMLAIVTLNQPKIEAAQARREISATESTVVTRTLEQTALMVFFLFCGLGPAIGVVILAQDALISEKQSGTEAWVFSKPVSRVAFLLAKFSSDALGILVTMVAIQGLVAYAIIKAGTEAKLPLSGFLFALGLIFLLLVFFLTLTYMLGILFHKRGAVIGIPMILVFGNQLTGIFPWLGRIMPWNLVLDLGSNYPALSIALVNGQQLPTVCPIIGTIIFIIIFLVISLWRIQREEF